MTMDSLTAKLVMQSQDSAMLEAEELIQAWLEGVEQHTDVSPPPLPSRRPYHPTAVTPHSQDTLEFGGPSSATDFLSAAVDWEGEGGVEASARAVVDGLMRTSLKSVRPPPLQHPQGKGRDPQLTMEMRHRAVRERRQRRDQDRVHRLQAKRTAREARSEAEGMVLREERERRATEAREEELVKREMAALRRQLHEEQETRRLFHRSHRQQSSVSGVECDAVTVCGGEAVREGREERRRQHTRAQLLSQFRDAESREAKEDLKLAHRCFSSWHSLVHRERARLRKAEAVGVWRLLLRAWQAWRVYVRHRRAHREREEVARALLREKRLLDKASLQYSRRLQSKTLLHWHSFARSAQTQRLLDVQTSSQRERVRVFLQTATEHQTAAVVVADRSLRAPSTEGGREERPLQSGSVVTTCGPGGLDAVSKTSLTGRVSSPKTTAKPVKPAHQVSRTVARETVLWKKARKEIDELLAQDGVGIRSHSHSTEIKKPKPKPVTKPIPMSGMEERAGAIAERREVRERRREEAERVRVEELVRREGERRKEELTAKETAAAQRREERRLAKQREQERLARQQRLAELLSKATAHHDRRLLRERGLAPWRRFVSLAREDRLKAASLRQLYLQRSVFRRWLGSVRSRVRERETRADCLRRTLLLRRFTQSWRQCVLQVRCREAEAAACYPVLLSRCVLLSWARVTREERVLTAEGEWRARRHRERKLKQRALGAWLTFVPWSKEERGKEQRRAELRHKVASWLTDYRPLPPSD